MGYPASPSTRRPMSGPDLAASSGALALTVVFGAAAAFFGMSLCVVAIFLGGVGYAVAVGA